MPKLAFISIGSNMGDRNQYIRLSLCNIKVLPQTHLLKVSRIMETKALEVVEQPDFLNCIAKIQTSLEPLELLKELQKMEVEIGRIRRYDKGPREIDLDILSYGRCKIEEAILKIPHHSLYTRPFIRELLEEMGEDEPYKVESR
ncbi:MAG: 2-amino-4-hydroxy-6-hydroxymethyldihydropteridine diphosphokinase [Leptospiraceae bacterium]|nr:2-amino-4-hydroxy-6-hydroxymethyldihydropteridine diphosphokinase [Leptospiraceae bacterium]MCP5498292.1 2-amino-4-hydroxy-6-hydroxymethyldihydropteridine diphosphokinase [Leptospiraceae bacterium]